MVFFCYGLCNVLVLCHGVLFCHGVLLWRGGVAFWCVFLSYSMLRSDVVVSWCVVVTAKQPNKAVYSASTPLVVW